MLPLSYYVTRFVSYHDVDSEVFCLCYQKFKCLNVELFYVHEQCFPNFAEDPWTQHRYITCEFHS